MPHGHSGGIQLVNNKIRRQIKNGNTEHAPTQPLRHYYATPKRSSIPHVRIPRALLVT